MHFRPLSCYGAVIASSLLRVSPSTIHMLDGSTLSWQLVLSSLSPNFPARDLALYHPASAVSLADSRLVVVLGRHRVDILTSCLTPSSRNTIRLDE